MKFELLSIEDAAELIECAERSGDLLQQQQTSNEIVYSLKGSINQHLLINTPNGSYLITA